MFEGVGTRGHANWQKVFETSRAVHALAQSDGTIGETGSIAQRFRIGVVRQAAMLSANRRLAQREE